MTLNSAGVLLLYLMASSAARSQPDLRKTICNPIDIDYRYSTEQRDQRISYRAGADPVIIHHQGEYFLFVTNSRGWWRSRDLHGWEFVKPSIWPEEDMCAPAARSVRDTLYLFQSTFERRPIYCTTSPHDGQLSIFNPLLPPLPGALGPWDPDIFHDDASDQWYLYFGSSNFYPLYGIELDWNSGLTYRGTAKKLLFLDPGRHGWERFGRDHRDTTKPFIEGAWMTKWNGTYYLQYAAPGTEYNVYANGTYVGEHPLGPFTYAPYNPVSYRPGGFMTGAGHGNTFQDEYGNFWNTGTPWVGINWNFERRIAMFPAGFDSDGQMFVNTRFGDFPHYVPTRKWTDKDELFTGWMLLSYKKPCRASSVRDPYVPVHVTDENIRTFWVAGSNSPQEWLTIDLKRACLVKAVQVNYADFQSDIYANDRSVFTQFKLQHSLDGKSWKLLADLSQERRDRPNAYVELDTPVRTRFIRYEHVYVAARHLAVSDIRVFGNGDGAPPSVPGHLSVRRDADRRNAFVSWSHSPRAVGYNILWGIGEKKLYQTYQVFADQGNQLEIRALTTDQSYYFAIEAFDENGVSKASRPVYCP